MKTILQNFKYLIKKFKISNILNIIGLSAAFIIFTVIIIQTFYDFSFNRNFNKSNDIYLFSYYDAIYFKDRRTPSISVPLGKRISENFPEVKNYCLIKEDTWNPYFDTYNENGEKNVFNSILIRATKGFLDIFEPEILSGDPMEALTETQKAIIPESLAELLFGNKNPLGKIIFLHNSDIPITICAVYKDFPNNCSLKNGIYTYLPNDREEIYNYAGYFEINKKDLSPLLSKLNENSFLGESFSKIDLTQLTKIHFNLPEVGEANIYTTFSLLAIGILALIMAFINFMNFSISLAPMRVKTIYIQKIHGADSFIQKSSIRLEGVFITIIAFLLSLLYLVLLNKSFINEFFTADLSISKNIPVLIFIAVMLIIIGFLSGLYPAKYITSIDPANVLKGSFSHSLKSRRLRNFLIMIQFSCSITLIVISIFIKLQHDYMKNYSWGIEKENILYLPCSDLDTHLNTFGKELKNNPEIIDYTATSFLPGWVVQSWGIDFMDKAIDVIIWPVESNFLDFFGVDILKGRNFKDSDNGQNKQKIILNKKFIDQYELNDIDIIGQNFGEEDEEEVDIIGIMENINFESLKTHIKPMGFLLLPDDMKWNEWILVKVSGNDIKGTINYVKTIWEKFSAESFNIYFLDSKLESLYSKENNMAKLVGYCGIIAVLIAIMGVLGIAILNVKYREKEIALRKVNGAGIHKILFLLNRNTSLLILISFIISIPVSYFIIMSWLENFAYKIQTYWWVFLIGGLIVFIITIITINCQSYKAASTNPTKILNKL